VKFPHIHAAGDHYDIGATIGRQGRDAFHRIVRHLDRYRALGTFLGSDRLREIEERSRAAYPGFMREIDGIADGAEVDFWDVFLWNCRGDMPGDHGYTGAQGCTDVLLPGNAKDGVPAIIGHNEDDAPGLDGHCFLVTVEPDDGLAFTSFCSPGQLPTHNFAVNAAGLVQTINHIRPKDQKAGIARHLTTRAVMNCRSLDEARAVLERADRASGFHHNMGLPGAAALWSVEAPASGCSVIAVERPVAHANHLISAQFAGIDQQVAPSSRDRQARADALLPALGDSRDALAVLGDSAGTAWPICRKDTSSGDTGYTLASAVFEIWPDRVEWRVYDDPGRAPVWEATQPAEPDGGA
jgi:hypothetical protein